MGGSGNKPSNYGLASAMVLNKVKIALGMDQMRLTYSGAAPMTLETLKFFASIGVNINELYGMSECTGVTTWSSDYAHVWGAVGYPLDGMEVKVFKRSASEKKECPPAPADLTHIPEECQGELCFRGRHVMMGYMANPDFGPEHVEEVRKKNAEAIDEDGWLHSGDMGVRTTHGVFKITGRYKELIIGAGGENVAPIPIEEEVKRIADGVISNVQMVGDKRKYNIALITLTCQGATGERAGSDVLDGKAAKLFPKVHTVSEASASKEYISFLETCIVTACKNGAVCPSNAAKIAKFTILPIDFSVEGTELTATLKLKRNVVEKMYFNIIEAMYEENITGMYVPFRE